MKNITEILEEHIQELRERRNEINSQDSAKHSCEVRGELMDLEFDYERSLQALESTKSPNEDYLLFKSRVEETGHNKTIAKGLNEENAKQVTREVNELLKFAGCDWYIDYLEAI